MRVRRISEDERERYNRFVESSPRAHFLQSYEWGEVKRVTGWRPHRLVMEADGAIVGGASILERQVPGLGTLLYSPRGPLIDLKDTDLCQHFLEAVADLGRERRAILLKVDPDIPMDAAEGAEALEALGFRCVNRGEGFETIQPRFVMRLALDGDEDELLMNCHRKTRYNIRYAWRNGVNVWKAEDEEDLRRFYEILEVTAERQDFHIREYAYYQRIWRELVPVDRARLYLADVEGDVVAGTMGMHCGPTVWYVYGASSNRHRNLMPNYALQWEMVRWALEAGCSVYDMRGVSGNLDPDDPLYGLYRFKQGFGAEMVEYIGEFDLPLDTVRYPLWRGALSLRRRFRELGP